jgi:hypothetical protein
MTGVIAPARRQMSGEAFRDVSRQERFLEDLADAGGAQLMRLRLAAVAIAAERAR